MLKHLRSLPTPRRPINKGFSLPELLVIIVILGIIGSVGILSFFFLVRRARVQSVALEVAGWIENVRNAASDAIDQDQSLGGCLIAFDTDASVPPDILAEVNADCPVPETELRIPTTVQQDSVTIDIIAGPDEITFTPRGLWTGPGTTPGADFRMLITLDSGGPSRCVRLSPILGSVEIGRPDCGNGSNWQLL